jgi:hypothetical protein
MYALLIGNAPTRGKQAPCVDDVMVAALTDKCWRRITPSARKVRPFNTRSPVSLRFAFLRRTEPPRTAFKGWHPRVN